LSCAAPGRHTSRVALARTLGVTVCHERASAEKGGDRGARCFARDGGGPPGAALQEEASNRHELLGSRVLVVSVDGKGAAMTASGVIQRDERK
jgi:hypothetical protein